MVVPQDIAVILVAAGRGSRMGGGLPKQWRPLAGRPVIAHTVDAFRAAGLSRIIVAIHPDDHERAATLDLPLVHGGATRASSVRNVLEALASDPPSYVLIHDAARPLVSIDVISAVIDALQTHRAAAPGVPVTDALWRGVQGRVAETVPRDGLFRAQTPQGFHFEPILAAHRSASGDAADDVEIARAEGIDVWITPGCDENIKLTYPVDFIRAERVISERLTK